MHFIEIKPVLIRLLTSSITTSFRVVKLLYTWLILKIGTYLGLFSFFAVAITVLARRFDIFFAILCLSTSPWRLGIPRLNTGKGFEYLFSKLTCCKFFEIVIIETRSWALNTRVWVSHVYDLLDLTKVCCVISRDQNQSIHGGSAKI